jgi:hypothetical protein
MGWHCCVHECRLEAATFLKSYGVFKEVIMEIVREKQNIIKEMKKNLFKFEHFKFHREVTHRWR